MCGEAKLGVNADGPRTAGAKKVYFALASQPVRFPKVYGIASGRHMASEFLQRLRGSIEMRSWRLHMPGAKPLTSATRSAVLSGVLLASLGLPAHAQDLASGADSADGRIKVIVTGSNIPTLDHETAVPVQIITREDIQRANVQTAADLAQTISANMSFGSFTENQALAFAGGPGNCRGPRCEDSTQTGRSSWSTGDESRTTRLPAQSRTST